MTYTTYFRTMTIVINDQVFFSTEQSIRLIAPRQLKAHSNVKSGKCYPHASETFIWFQLFFFFIKNICRHYYITHVFFAFISIQPS